MILKFKDKTPDIHKNCFIAPNATVLGNVKLAEDSTVWYGAVLRGDGSKIIVGKGSNIQDNSVVHCDHDFPVVIGENVTVGHGAIIHGCTINNTVMVGMGATVLNGAVIGEGSIIGAGALVREGQIIPENSLVVGMPAKVIKETTEEQRKAILENAEHYIALGREHKYGELTVKGEGLFKKCFEQSDKKSQIVNSHLPFEDGYYVTERDVILMVRKPLVYVLTESGWENKQHMVDLWYDSMTDFADIPDDIAAVLRLDEYKI